MAKKTLENLKPKVIRQVNIYKKALQEADIPVEKIIVFGSQAKGTAHKWSDIDLAIISTTFGKDRHNERVKLMHIRNDDVLDIEPHPFHPDDLKEKWSTIAHEIRTHGIPIAF